MIRANDTDKTKYSSLPEEQVVMISQDGDEKARDFLIRRYEPMVKAKSKSYYLIGADGEDIVQEGMIGLYKAIRDFRMEKNVSFKAFADICITRQIITAIKSATRQKHTPLNTYVSFNKPVFDEESEKTLIDVIGAEKISDPEELVIGKEDCDAIESVIGKLLSDFERDVLKRYVCGNSYQTISVELDKPVKSVDNAIQRIKRKLEQHLNQADS